MMKYLKLISINLIVCLALVLTVETSAYFLRTILNKSNVG